MSVLVLRDRVVEVPVEDWHGCYSLSWKGVIVNEAFKHPAKFSRGLIERIVYTGLERGWWAKGLVIGDPFGGVGCGGIVASYAGLQWIGTELEPRFVRMAIENFSKHARERRSFGLPEPRILHGDAREFAALAGQVRPKALTGIITSPPYADAESRRAGGPRTCFPDKRGRALDGAHGYGVQPGQIGELRSGSIDGAITSPPWANRFDGAGTEPRPPHKKDGLGRSKRDYVDYAGTGTEGQLGGYDDETYWMAMAKVYAQMLQALAPGGIATVVVKDYVKGGVRVPLCLDTLKLRRRDPLNAVAAMKASIDGLVDAGVLADDDKLMPGATTFGVDKKNPRVVVVIRPVAGRSA